MDGVDKKRRNAAAVTRWHHSGALPGLFFSACLTDAVKHIPPCAHFATRPPGRRWTASLCALALAVGALGAPNSGWSANAEQPAALSRPDAPSRLPSLGDSASDGLDVGMERHLGDQIMREIRRDPAYIDDPVLLEYLQSVWQPLLGAARSRGEIGPEIDQRFAWEPFLVRDRSVNAFALPGGFVGVHLGLIAMTATRDELASVLAHEMSHVTQRHIARGMANSKRQSILGAAAMILGVLAATRSNAGDGANAVLAGGQALAAQGELNFSRDMEREADRIGFNVMTGAGFAPGGMAAMFEKLEQNSRLNDGGGFPYLRSHPLTTERIGAARARLGTTSPAAPVSGLSHAVAQARARVLMDPRVVALRRWQQAKAPDKSAALHEQVLSAYSTALAATMLRDWPHADEALQSTLRWVRSSPRRDPQAERDVALLGVQSFLDRGDTAQAAEWLKPYRTRATETAAATSSSESRSVMLLAAQLAQAQPQDADGLRRSADELQTWTSLQPLDAAAWSALGRIWQQLGQPLRSLRADAESRVALGDLTGAVDRLREGQRQSRAAGGGRADFIEASVIDARLRTLEALRRRQAEEDK